MFTAKHSRGRLSAGRGTSLSRSGALEESEGAHLDNAVLHVHGIFRAIVQWQSTSCGSRSLNSAASKPRRNTTAVEEKSTRVEARGVWRSRPNTRFQIFLLMPSGITRTKTTWYGCGRIYPIRSARGRKRLSRRPKLAPTSTVGRRCARMASENKTFHLSPNDSKSVWWEAQG